MEHFAITEKPFVTEYDGVAERKNFQETKAGVKGLVDSGITKIPRMFAHDPKILSQYPTTADLQVPLIDLEGLKSNQRMKTVENVRQAAETWGFFQVINHGVPETVMDDLLQSVKQFNEQPTAIKKEFYSRDQKKLVRFLSNGNVKDDSQVGIWKDTLLITLTDCVLDLEALPVICRKAIEEYVNYMIKWSDSLSEVLSEALGLSKDHLSKIECMNTAAFACHYAPACPEPHLTVGSLPHFDPNFFTILLQDNVGGLQVLRDNQWVDVPPTKGALIVNIGDLMQLMTNDKFKSVKHRVLANSVGPRLSAGCFFSPSPSKLCGPIEQLISPETPPIYREIRPSELYMPKLSEGPYPPLTHFKI